MRARHERPREREHDRKEDCEFDRWKDHSARLACDDGAG
jgi:hypothetical protein